MGVEVMTCPESPSHGTVEVAASTYVNGTRQVVLACGYTGPYLATSMAPPSQVAAGNDLNALGNFVGDQNG